MVYMWKFTDEDGSSFKARTIETGMNHFAPAAMPRIKGACGTKTFVVFCDGSKCLIQRWNGTEYADIRCTAVLSKQMSECGLIGDECVFKESVNFELDA